MATSSNFVQDNAKSKRIFKKILSTSIRMLNLSLKKIKLIAKNRGIKQLKLIAKNKGIKGLKACLKMNY